MPESTFCERPARDGKVVGDGGEAGPQRRASWLCSSNIQSWRLTTRAYRKGSGVRAGVALLAWLLQQRAPRHRMFALLEAMENLRQGVAGLPELAHQVCVTL